MRRAARSTSSTSRCAPKASSSLGSSDSIDEGSPLFTVLDKKSRLYAQRPALRAKYPILPGPGTLAFGLSLVEAPKSSRLAAIGPASIQGQPATPALVETTTEGRAASWAALHYRAARTGRAALADRRRRPQHRAPVGKRGRFLQLSGGEPTKNLLRLVDPALRIEMRAALYRGPAVGHADRVRPVDRRAERPADAGHDPGRAGRRGRAGILPGRHRCEGSGEAAVGSNGNGNTATLHPVAEHLDREVERLKAHLRDTVEQYEASNEELKAGNEELQAMNEELRSATEELETGREELQSINEELSTVNSELKNKVEELGSSNSDMLNLMDATAIPSVFLDRELHITRYTPPAVEVFNLIPADIGRPLLDLRTELHYPELADDAERVLKRLVPIEREISRGGATVVLGALAAVPDRRRPHCRGRADAGRHHRAPPQRIRAARRRGAAAPDRRERARLRDLHARSRPAHHDLELRRRAHARLSRGRGPRAPAAT